MNVLVTGACGFLGQRLLAALLVRGAGAPALPPQFHVQRIHALDQILSPNRLRTPRIEYRIMDTADEQSACLIDEVLADDCGLIFHLAAVVSGTAEADFDLGMRVNVDGTRLLLDRARRAAQVRGAPIRVVFASSVAVFGGALPNIVTDDTPATPRSSYGIQKLIGEILITEYSRREYIEGRAVRIPTIVVRGGAPNGAASGFASGIIREPLAGLEAICPVDPDTLMWIASSEAAVDSLIHAASLKQDRWGARPVLNLPGLSVEVGEMVETLTRVAGRACAERVRWSPDPRIGRIVQSWPARFRTERAEELGFPPSPNFEEIVRAYMRTLPVPKS